jgi:hypothetical protein
MAIKCISRKKGGSKCGADAQTGKSLCVFHDPEKSETVRRARRAGGIARTRGAAILPSNTSDHSLRNTGEVSEFLAESINQLRRGQLDPRVANGIGYLTSVLLRALELGPLEARVARLEAATATAQIAITAASERGSSEPQPVGLQNREVFENGVQTNFSKAYRNS